MTRRVVALLVLLMAAGMSVTLADGVRADETPVPVVTTTVAIEATTTTVATVAPGTCIGWRYGKGGGRVCIKRQPYPTTTTNTTSAP